VQTVKKSWKSILVGLGLTLAVIVVLGLIKFFQIRQAIQKHSSFQPPPEGVSVITVREEPWVPLYRVAGIVKALNGITVKAEEAGKIVEIVSSAGAVVKAGDVMLRMDTSVERAELHAAKARLAWATAEYDRTVQLWASKATSKATLESALLNRNQAMAEAERIEAVIKRKDIRAPFDGSVGIWQVKIGDYVNAGTTLTELQDSSILEVDFAIPARFLPFLKMQDVIRIDYVAPVDTKETLKAQIVGIDPVADAGTLTVNVRARFVSGITEKIIPGMSVGVSVPGAAMSHVILVPASAISYAPYGNSVFIIEREGEVVRVKSKTVRTGLAVADSVPILEGLKNGDEIVTAGVFKLRDGGAVTVNNTVPAQSVSPLPNS
jgi:membrane fusion protein (multidrug efflux system)